MAGVEAPRRRSTAIDALWQDVRGALRALRSSRSYAVWVVASLAIGMSVTIAAFALLNATMVLPFPEVTDQHRLVRVSVSRNCGRPDCWRPMSAPADYAALAEGLTGLEGLAAYTVGDVAAALPAARSLRAAFTSANYFDVLGVRAALGRTFDSADASTAAAVALVSHSTWIREFDGDPAAIGQSVRVADRFVQIVGVTPPNFIGTDRIRPGGRAPDLWLPMWLAGDVLPSTAAEQQRQERSLAFVGRLRDGADAAALQAEAEVVASRLAAGTPGSMAEVRRVWRVRPETWHIGFIVVMPIPILVLVIACVNAANLMLARGSHRRREIAIRLAIGAARGRIVRQLLFESALLALCATAIAVPIALWALRLASAPLDTPIPFDPAVLALTILTAAATAVGFGLAPAVRVSAQRPSTTLGSTGGHQDAPPRESRMRRALVVAQVALSVGLMATAWQLVSTVRAQAVSSGTPPDHLLVARFDLQTVKLAPGSIDGFYRDLVAGAMRLPGVEAAGVARSTAVWTFGQRASSASLVVWRSDDRVEQGRTMGGGYAGADLFDAVGLRVVSGRNFTEADRRYPPQVAVVNVTAARHIGGPAVGSTMRIASRGGDFRSSIDVRVIGVIEGAVEPRLERDDVPAPKVYLPSPIEPEPALALYLRTRGNAALAAQPVRELVARIAPRVPVHEIGSLTELNERSYETQLWLARAAAFVGVVGLLLATAGLYGVSSYVVAMRAREMAIRMAMGARPRAILTMVLRHSMTAAVIGVFVGGGAALAVSRIIQSEYHGIVGIDSAAFGGAVALFMATMLIAGAVPAVRASRVDPVECLKDI